MFVSKVKGGAGRWKFSVLSGTARDAQKNRTDDCQPFVPESQQFCDKIIWMPFGWNSLLFAVATFLEVWRPATQKHTCCCPAGNERAKYVCKLVTMTMTMTMTHSEKSHISQMRAWPYRQECRGHGPTKKNLSYWGSLLLGKVCKYKLLWTECNAS